MARSKSSNKWLAEHFDDEYVKKAQQQGLRSRSAFKLLELQEKHRLIKARSLVVDLGCAPGGWCQIVVGETGRHGQVIGLDILPMEPIDGVEFIEGDFTEDEPLARLEAALNGRMIDLVLSDMAPNMTGVATMDQARAMYLAELALDFVKAHLKPGGDFLVKMFHGEDFDTYVRTVRSLFDKVTVRKPKASRPRSREVYLLALGLKLKQ